MLLQKIIQLWPDKFKWKEPPYEYEYNKRPIDLILGSSSLADQIQQIGDLDAIEASWLKPAKRFKTISMEFWLYG